MPTRPFNTRCWITGAHLRHHEAFLLDRELAGEIRRDLAQKLAVIDQVLAEFSPRADQTERARALGLSPFAQRLVCAQLAEAYGHAVGAAELFMPFLAAARRELLRWVDSVKRDERIARRFAETSEKGWARLFEVARRIRRLLSRETSVALLRRHADACLARIYPHEDPAGVERWLADMEPSQLVAQAEIPDPDRRTVLWALAERTRGHSSRSAGAMVSPPRVADPDPRDALEAPPHQPDAARGPADDFEDLLSPTGAETVEAPPACIPDAPTGPALASARDPGAEHQA